MKDLKFYLSAVDDIFASEQFMAEPVELYAPIDYALRMGGKRIRPTLLLAAGAMFGAEIENLRDAALAVETYHNYTLLHDDLMDRSPLRRGQPTVYRKWDENTAVLSGDTMYALAWRYMLRHQSEHELDALKCFCETGIQVCEGQQMDMNFERRDDVSVAEYMEMIRLKTAVLLAGAVKIGLICADAPQREQERMYNFAIHMGLAFQLQDDLLDCYGNTEVFGKKTGQDIRDGKKTYLLLRAAQMADDDQRRQLMDAMHADDRDSDRVVEQVRAIYDAIGLRTDVEKTITVQFAQAETELAAVHASDEAKLPFRELLGTLQGRKK